VLPLDMMPSSGAVDAALDALILTPGQPGENRVVKVVRTGEVIPADNVAFEGLRNGLALRPRTPLPPNEKILVGTYHQFQTGSAAKRGAGGWSLVSSEEATQSGCGSSCGSTHSLTVKLMAADGQTGEAFFLLVEAQDGRPYDPSQAPRDIVQIPASTDTIREIYLPSHPGQQLYLVPLSSSGERGAPIGPISFDDGFGCALGGGWSPTPTLPWVLLASAAATLRIGARTQRRRRNRR
jgi:hypothetical protein